LDLHTANVRVDYTLNGIRYHREHLATAVDNCIAIRLTADAPGSISFRLHMERGPGESYSSRYFDTVKPIEGHAFGLLAKGQAGGEDGVRFAACIRAVNQGGRARIIGETLLVEEADAVTLIFAAATSFREVEPAAFVLGLSLAATGKGWEAIATGHEQEYRAYFDRVDLQLGDDGESAAAASVPTGQRLERLLSGNSDPALAALYFQYGRYLLISSSRPGSLPANLQGIWNLDFLPFWGSKFTININLKMNYWPAEACNLAECHEVFLRHDSSTGTWRIPK
jgi:alpha-L-fucosidase 2